MPSANSYYNHKTSAHTTDNELAGSGRELACGDENRHNRQLSSPAVILLPRGDHGRDSENLQRSGNFMPAPSNQQLGFNAPTNPSLRP